MKEQTLLQKATNKEKPIIDEKEMLELSLAWVRNDINLSQVSFALSRSASEAYSYLSLSLKKYINANK